MKKEEELKELERKLQAGEIIFPKAKTIEDHIREEKKQVFDKFNNPRANRMKFFQALEDTTWQKRIIGSYKHILNHRKASIIARRQASIERIKRVE